MAVPVSITKY